MRHFWRLSAVLAAAAFFLSAPVEAQVQGGVNQQGAVTAGNCVKWIRNGVIADTGSTCGGAGGSPGGTSGQIQFNNTGSFGGFTASGDATINTGTGALTLSTVNANVGSFGSATQCVSFTTNAKGLITAASQTTCTPAVASITGLGTGVGAALAAALNSSTGLIGALTPTNNNCVVGNGTAWTSTTCPGGGGGNVSNSGTPTSGQAAEWTSATVIQGVSVTGSGNYVKATSPTLVTPALGTPSALVGTNVTGVPISTGISGLGTGVAAAAAANLNAGTGIVGALTPTNLNCIVGNGTAWTSAACSAGSGTVTSVTPGGGLVSAINAACSQTAITGSGTLSVSECFRAVTGTTDTVLDTDRGKLVTYSNTASIAVTLPQAGAASAFVSGWTARFKNINTGPVVITPATSTINGVASLTVLPGQGVKISSDGTNYTATTEAPTALATQTLTGANPALISSYYGSVIYLNNAANQVPTLAQAGTTGFPAGWYGGFCNIGAGTQTITPTTSTIGGASTYLLRAGSAGAPVCVTVLSDGTNYLVYPGAPAMGTNVPAALSTALSAAGGLTSTIASGSTALGTGLLTSGSCATVITVGAANVASTDTIMITPNASIKAVTGYAPVTTGGLQITPYPTAGNVNFDQCNPTSASITPGAVTINWRVVR